LAFLHDKNLVQGELKPPNVLVVGDQVKLASDNIRAADEPRTGIAKTSLYDPPEAENGRISAAGDMWALGITLVEALTQRPPEQLSERSETVALPAGLPAKLGDPLRSCLSRNPADRPTAAGFEARLNGAPPEHDDSIPQRPFAPVITAIPVMPVVAVLILGAALWAGLRLFHHPKVPQQPAAAPVVSVPATAANSAPPQAAASEPVSRTSQPSAPSPAPSPADTATAVLHEEIPNVPRSASATIQGRLNVAVRVTVDASGNVVDETLEHPGPSKYFARLATAAASKWKFAPAAGQASRERLLWFEFTRGGTTARAANP
jgi:TonB family protein